MKKTVIVLLSIILTCTLFTIYFLYSLKDFNKIEPIGLANTKIIENNIDENGYTSYKNLKVKISNIQKTSTNEYSFDLYCRINKDTLNGSNLNLNNAKPYFTVIIIDKDSEVIYLDNPITITTPTFNEKEVLREDIISNEVKKRINPSYFTSYFSKFEPEKIDENTFKISYKISNIPLSFDMKDSSFIICDTIFYNYLNTTLLPTDYNLTNYLFDYINLFFNVKENNAI